MDLLLLLFAVSLFSVGYGLWIGYRDRHLAPAYEPVVPSLPDEDLLIFDRVTAELSALPPLNNLRAMEAARADVMQKVGEQYGLSPTQVETIYWRVWRSIHRPRR
ncbi:MAG TPA: hypothetical protein VFM04_00605 [Candidatus Methylomirabilis sp.]|nr:hypothetical protein [Candidatus Methylomirabilis sp.]